MGFFKIAGHGEESGALNIERFRPISFVGSVFKLLTKDR